MSLYPSSKKLSKVYTTNTILIEKIHSKHPQNHFLQLFANNAA